jgi:hypothetical protein
VYSIRRILLTGSMAFALAWLVAGCSDKPADKEIQPPAATTPAAPTPTIRPEEEDRPPIIISGGSINFWVPVVGDRGEWKKVKDDNNNVWYHAYTPKTGTETLKYLKLNIVNGKKKDDAKCANADNVYKLSGGIAIDTGPNRDVKVGIVDMAGTNVLQVTFDGLFVGQKQEEYANFWLRDGGPSPRSVTFTEEGMRTPLKCELSGHAVLTLRQIVDKTAK